MQYHIAFEHPTDPLFPMHAWEVPTLSEPEYTRVEEIITGDNIISVDEYAARYLFATEELGDMMMEHHTLLRDQPALLLLMRKLMSMFQEAAGGNFQALKDVTNSGESTMLGILDIVGTLATTQRPSTNNNYTELESSLRALYDKYF